jgi:hypothetical protein
MEYIIAGTHNGYDDYWLKRSIRTLTEAKRLLPEYPTARFILEYRSSDGGVVPTGEIWKVGAPAQSQEDK